MKKFFLSVQTFRNTTELGRIVARDTYDKFHHTIIYEGQIADVAGFIEKTMNDVIRQNYRLKPMKVVLMRFSDTFVIDLRPQTNGYDKKALSLTGTAVFNDFTGNKEGGEQ